MPPEAKGTDAKAAEAFVKFYWEMVNYAQATGDVHGLQELDSKCQACDNGVDFVRNAYGNGGEIRGGSGKPGQFKTVFINRGGEQWAVVECRVLTSKQTVDLPGTDNDQHFPGGATNIRVYLQPRAGSWTVRSLATR
jgi:hypothetical protein